MTKADMTIEQLEDLAFAHGADLAAWPEDLRMRAAACLAADPAAAEALARVERLETALASVRPADPAPSAALMSRILADAASQRPVPAPDVVSGRRASWTIVDRLRAFLSPAAACAASAALGVWLGYAGPVDFSTMAADALGVETGGEFAFLDGDVASSMADLIEALGVEE